MHHHPPGCALHRPLPRGSLLAAGGALGAAALLTACGDDREDSGSGGAGDDSGGTGFTFTDDRDETVSLDRAPDRIVAYVTAAAALYDYGIDCVGIFGPSSPVDGERNPHVGDLDVSTLTSLGEAWGEFNVEKYAGLEPDLLISNMVPPPDLWYVPEDSADEIYELAPSIGIRGSRDSLLHPLRRYTQLARALGADLTATSVTSAKTRFEEAAGTLRQATRDNGGITVMAVSATEENFYIAIPGSYCDLHYFKDLGVEFAEGEKVDDDGFWEILSWENADKHHADLIMIDNRESMLSDQDLNARPTWTSLPAVAAGQTTSWAIEERFSYAAYAPVVETLAEAVRTARKLS